MRIVIAAVGRVRAGPERSLLDDYLARIARYATIDEIELRDERDDKLTDALARTLARVGPSGEAVALDVQGRALSSEAFARTLGQLQDRAGIPVFLLGGAEGLPDSVRASARWKLSLGPMTLPHRLARIVLCEQIYRGFTILRGEPYAREG